MQFLIIARATKYSEAGINHGQEYHTKMDKYCESLKDAGVLVVTGILEPSSSGLRINYPEEGVKPVITSGPFSIDSISLSEYTLIQVDSEQEAMNWALRMPIPKGKGKFELELRRLRENPPSNIEPIHQAMENNLLEQRSLLKYINHQEETQ
jgi:hypothetical protein